jgi:hypothetical protein
VEANKFSKKINRREEMKILKVAFALIASTFVTNVQAQTFTSISGCSVGTVWNLVEVKE